MNPHRCCRIAANRLPDTPANPQGGAGGPHLPKSGGRPLGIAGLGLAGTILAIMPKCPVCLALYVMVWTGVWLPLTTATYLRASLLVLGVASLLCLTAMFLYRFPIVKETLATAKGRLPMLRPKETAQ